MSVNAPASVKRVGIAYLFASGLPEQGLEKSPVREFIDAATATEPLPEAYHQPQELVLMRRPFGGPPETEIRVGLFAPGGQSPGLLGVAPFRFLYARAGQALDLDEVARAADSVYAAFTRLWGAGAGTAAVVEISVTAQRPTAFGNAQQLINERLAAGAKTLAAADLGDHFDLIGVKISSALLIGAPAESAPLADAQAEITLEPLAGDHSQLFVNFVLRWPMLQLAASQLPPAFRSHLGPAGVVSANQERLQPSGYMSRLSRFFGENFAAFLTNLDQQRPNA